MSPPDIQIEVFGKTDVGLIREHNEDNLLVADLGGALRESELDAPAKLKLGEHGALFLVCDGMGGAAAGEVASQMAVDAIFDSLAACDPQPRDAFARALRRAVEAGERADLPSIAGQPERAGHGTTCTAAALIDETLVVAQIGDSRCYVFRNGRLGQVTKDQSLAWQLIEAGAMTPEDAKAFEHANIILQALGVQDRVDVVLSQVVLRQGDVVVLCSDGLHGPVVDQEIEEVLSNETDLKKAGDGLLQKAPGARRARQHHRGSGSFRWPRAQRAGRGRESWLRELRPRAGPAIRQRDGRRGGGSPDANDPTGGSPVPSATGVETTDEIPPGRRAAEGSMAAGRAGVASLFGGRRKKAKRVAKPDSSPSESTRPSSAHRRDELDDEGESPPSRLGRSVVALFFLAVLAAAAGGIIVLRCERDQAVRSESTNP